MELYTINSTQNNRKIQIEYSPNGGISAAFNFDLYPFNLCSWLDGELLADKKFISMSTTNHLMLVGCFIIFSFLF